MGKLFWGLVIVIAIVAIAGLLYRPATVIGTSEKSVAYSVRQEAGSDDAACRGEDDQYRCVVGSSDSGSPARSGYRVDVDNYGCWDARSLGGGEASGAGFAADLSGCITVKDLIRSDD
jgi:hypothetical protein